MKNNRQPLICSCGHTGVRYKPEDFTPLYERMMVAGFVYDGGGEFDASRLSCSACGQRGQVKAV